MNFLKEHKESLYDLRKSNPLLDLPVDKFPEVIIESDVKLIDASEYPIFKKIYSLSEKNQKAFGLRTLLVANSYLKWRFKGDEICSPVYLSQVEQRKIKGSKEPEFQINSLSFQNPLLNHLLVTEFGIEIEDENFSNFIQKNNFELVPGSWVGNFNYKKYKLVDDYQNISLDKLSGPMNTIVHGEKTSNTYVFNEIRNILPLDISQEKVLLGARNDQNVILEGPPGTGKSRTIASIIGQNVYDQKSCLFVAEKRNALDVVSSILKEHNIGHLASTIHDSEQDKKRFINELKESWEVLLTEIDEPKNFVHSRHQVDFILKKLNSSIIGSKIPYQNLVDELCEKSGENSLTIINPSIALVEDWLKHREIIISAFNLLKVQGKNHFGETSVKYLNQHLFLTPNFLDKFDHYLTSLLNHIENVEVIAKHDELSTLSSLVKVGSISRLVQSNPSLSFSALSKVTFRKAFKKKRKELLLVEAKLKDFEPFIKQWHTIWNIQEINTALNSLNNSSLLKQKSRKEIERQFEKHFSQGNVALPIENVLNSTKEYWNLISTLNSIKAELLADYSIEDPSIQLNLVNEIITYFENSDIGILTWFRTTKNIDSIMKSLDAQYVDIQQIVHYTKLIFHNAREESIRSIKQQIVDLKKESNLSQIANILVPIAKSCQQEVFQLIVNSEQEFKALNYSLLSSFYKSRSTTDSEYHKIDDVHLQECITRQIRQELNYTKHNVQTILYNSNQTFNLYNKILETPSSKLKGDQKNLKKRLRKGKSILSKEFGKQRSFKSIRFLMESEARDWIKVLKPVLFMSPISVSEIFPLEEQFDQIIFDEASQMPIEDTIPSLQRARQVVIAGDSQQMPPSNYFQSNNSENFSLLAYCKYEFENYALKYHYRSHHHALIEFSNQHFYHNQLKTISAPDSRLEPLKLIKLKNNTYQQGVNSEEAKEIIDYLKRNIASYSNQQIGLFTLSEKQSNLLSNLVGEELELKLYFARTNSFIRSLENLQGEECDVAIISLTHGLNSEGKFSLNFGPINQLNGKKRLNVLFTRAKEQMITFMSFDPILLNASSNEGIGLLKSFIDYTLDYKTEDSNEQLINFEILDPHLNFHSSGDLISYYNLLMSKGIKPHSKLSKTTI